MYNTIANTRKTLFADDARSRRRGIVRRRVVVVTIVVVITCFSVDSRELFTAGDPATRVGWRGWFSAWKWKICRRLNNITLVARSCNVYFVYACICTAPAKRDRENWFLCRHDGRARYTGGCICWDIIIFFSFSLPPTSSQRVLNHNKNVLVIITADNTNGNISIHTNGSHGYFPHDYIHTKENNVIAIILVNATWVPYTYISTVVRRNLCTRECVRVHSKLG